MRKKQNVNFLCFRSKSINWMGLVVWPPILTFRCVSIENLLLLWRTWTKTTITNSSLLWHAGEKRHHKFLNPSLLWQNWTKWQLKILHYFDKIDQMTIKNPSLLWQTWTKDIFKSFITLTNLDKKTIENPSFVWQTWTKTKLKTLHYFDKVDKYDVTNFRVL